MVRHNGFSGTLEVTPIDGNDPNQYIFINYIRLINSSTGDGCPINGESKSHAALQGNLFSDVFSYTNLDICGQLLSGQVVFSGANWTAVLSEMDDRTYDIDKGAEVQVEVAWHPETNTLSGDGSAIIDGKAFDFQADQIIIRRNRRYPQDILLPASLDTFQHFILIFVE